MPTSQIVSIAGRNIYIVTGITSQTVNVCSASNQRGEYEWIVRLAPTFFVNSDYVRSNNKIDGLIKWLKLERYGHIEKQPENGPLEGSYFLKSVSGSLELEEQAWVEHVIRLTETCIDELVWEFLEMPYLHRVEHSIHVRLYELLRTQPFLNRHFSLEGRALTQPIHKEWPETRPRPEKSNRRGNFDLAILSPVRLKRTSLKAFHNGLVEPSIVIEMGQYAPEYTLLIDTS